LNDNDSEGAKRLQEKVPGNAPVFFTGHSLGGPLAMLPARRFLEAKELEDLRSRLKLGGVYAYGQPMVGNEAFARGFGDAPVFRHVYERDVVPHLPPVECGGYTHAGQELKVPSGSGGQGSLWAPARHESRQRTVAEIPPMFLWAITDRSSDGGRVGELRVSLAGICLPGFGKFGGMLVSLLPGSSFSLRNLAVSLRPPGKNGYRLDHHIPAHYVRVAKGQ
jgi:hypothetical protein